MTDRTAALVLTTINDPIVLDACYENFARYGHLDQVTCYLIIDKKTPDAAIERCRTLQGRGWDVRCPSLAEQDAYTGRFGLSPEFIPLNSDNRRNVGYLMAYESGADFVISIDDDNFPHADEDFFAEHAVVCRDDVDTPVVQTETGYFNICTMLDFAKPGPVYPRGFPYAARHRAENATRQENLAPVHINAGLWLKDPDCDAITWLVNPPQATAVTAPSVTLGAKAWSPINTQNTALRRDALGAYYFVRMGYEIGGNAIDRYGDIFSGYFVQACARHLGGAIRVGTPVAEHRRNSHSYLNDATREWACILLLEEVLPWLTTQARLSGATYADAYDALSHGLEDLAERTGSRFWSDAVRGFFHQMAHCMRQWTRACRIVDGCA